MAATSFQCLLGASQWDAVGYARAMTGDTNPDAFIVPDTSYEFYVEAAAETFSRFKPLGDFVLGSPMSDPPTSPLNTQPYVQRYSLSPSYMASQNLPPVLEITDVLYRVGEQILVGADLAFFLLIPSSPLGRFVLDPSSPTSRILRNNFLNELDHYGVGFWTREWDSDGFPAIDLWPIPQTESLPILVRYSSAHQVTALNDQFGSVAYPSIMEQYKRTFGDLLYAQVLEQNAIRFAGATSLQSGIIKRTADPQMYLNLACKARNRAELALGSASPIVFRWE